MLVLFDQGTPVPLRQFLAGHPVRTAAEQDWATLGNGALLDAAEAAGFQVLVTTDKNLRMSAACCLAITPNIVARVPAAQTAQQTVKQSDDGVFEVASIRTRGYPLRLRHGRHVQRH